MSRLESGLSRTGATGSVLARTGSVRSVFRRQSWSWLPAALTPRSAWPDINITLEYAVPVWVLRALGVVSGLVCTALVATSPVHWIIAGVLIVLTGLGMDSALSVTFAVFIGLLALGARGDPSVARTVVLVAGVHLGIQLAVVTTHLPWSTVVERGALVPSARTFLGIQALTQSTALVGAWAATRGPATPWMAVMAGLALAVVAWALLVRLRNRP